MNYSAKAIFLGSILYKEETTKTTTFDAQGNVLDTHVEHNPRPDETHIRDTSQRAHGYTSSQDIGGLSSYDSGDTSYTNRGRMASDQYGRTGATNYQSDIGSSQAGHGAGAGRENISFRDKVTSQAEKTAGKMTSDPNMFNRGEARAAGKFSEGARRL
ncbi:hypothetical protein EXT55_22295 [Pectobacterium carotovorum subsp. carotovorum]|nr:hypothetical protein [Pectobacterium carotovorum subsp. carotovorum]